MGNEQRNRQHERRQRVGGRDLTCYRWEEDCDERQEKVCAGHLCYGESEDEREIEYGLDNVGPDDQICL